MEQGRDASIGKKRQAIDQLIIGVYRVCSRRKNLLHISQAERVPERQGLAGRPRRHSALPMQSCARAAATAAALERGGYVVPRCVWPRRYATGPAYLAAAT